MKPLTRLQFVDKYTSVARKLTEGTGLFPETLLSQAILESSGSYNINDWLVGGSKLSQVANNLFGIKASKGWKGAVYNIDTREETPEGKSYIEKNSTFRSYKTVEDSMADWVNFLKSNKRYTTGGVFKATTIQSQFEALKNSGYATASNYVNMLMGIYAPLKKAIESIPIIKTTIGFGTIAILGLGLFFLAKKRKTRKLTIIA